MTAPRRVRVSRRMLQGLLVLATALGVLVLVVMDLGWVGQSGSGLVHALGVACFLVFVSVGAGTALALNDPQIVRGFAQGLVQETGDLSDQLSRYFSRQVADLLRTRGAGGLAPVRREITVLFADLSGFTTLSESINAEDTVATLTHYLDELVRVAMSHEGTVDKFMGDEVMVLFGAPASDLEHAHRAIACARDMQVVVGLLNVERGRRHLPTLGLTVGVNSGECVVGFVGGELRVQYSAIGDAVNVAKRIQGLARRGEIVVGEHTLRLAEQAGVEIIEEHRVKGRAAPVRVARIQVGEAAAGEGAFDAA